MLYVGIVVTCQLFDCQIWDIFVQPLFNESPGKQIADYYDNFYTRYEEYDNFKWKVKVHFLFINNTGNISIVISIKARQKVSCFLVINVCVMYLLHTLWVLLSLKAEVSVSQLLKLDLKCTN